MPEVRWVARTLLHKRRDDVGEGEVPTPVLTLDQIEAWLKDQPVDSAYKRQFKEHLLAQVQAWRGEPEKCNPRDTCHCLDEGGNIHYCNK